MIDVSISLSEAANLVGASKTTVFRRIHAGKIRAVKNEFGEWRVLPDSLNGFRSRFGRSFFGEENRPLQTDEVLIARLRKVANELLDLAIALEQRGVSDPKS
jgi:excisionase family DNA binding protein